MNDKKLQKLKKIDVFLIFALCFPFHFLYEWFSNSLFALFFPVNESIWEHMKLILSSITLVGLFDLWYMKKNSISFHNFFLSLFLPIVFGISLYLAIYLPIYYKIGENMFFSIFLLFLVLIATQVLSYFLLKQEEAKWWDKMARYLLVGVFLLFGYFTYHPPKTDLFYDKVNEKYGTNIYIIR